MSPPTIIGMPVMTTKVTAMIIGIDRADGRRGAQLV